MARADCPATSCDAGPLESDAVVGIEPLGIDRRRMIAIQRGVSLMTLVAEQSSIPGAASPWSHRDATRFAGMVSDGIEYGSEKYDSEKSDDSFYLVASGAAAVP
ncbi:hypothetical protein [Halomonas sp. YLGW01]|uniref:hypothetical protein n=1 Tax=Halomonas sp. YLGW01 TaxID=2773308 RepID=UPI00177CD8B1|nr:hypothetical protein [Halomonas sp. YLGW01]